VSPRYQHLLGLCDLGLGCPELRVRNLSEIAVVRGLLGLRVECDVFFEASKSIGTYAAEASRLGEHRGLRSMAFRSRNDLSINAPDRERFNKRGGTLSPSALTVSAPLRVEFPRPAALPRGFKPEGFGPPYGLPKKIHFGRRLEWRPRIFWSPETDGHKRRKENVPQ
jgi:hypothetical protein